MGILNDCDRRSGTLHLVDLGQKSGPDMQPGGACGGRLDILAYVRNYSLRLAVGEKPHEIFRCRR